jgi:hypothetical protein
MSRRLLVLSMATALASGCGGGGDDGSQSASSTSAQPADYGRDAATRLLRAARTHDRLALWGLLSMPSRRRLGPTFEEFRRTGAPKAERTVRDFLGGFRTVVSERITGRFGLVAIASASGKNVLAMPLRREHGTWKLELGSGPVGIRILGPDIESVGHVRQIAFEVRRAPEGATAVLYADGLTVPSREAVARGTATVYANLTDALPPGRHNAVAFATAGDAAAAKAWTFVSR